MRAPDRLAQMCGDDSRDIAGLPIDLIAEVVEPTETQRAALDELGAASVTAAQNIKAACPTKISLTAPSRLASMQQRIEAMIAAVATVQPAWNKFYGLLDDEQKARLTALGEKDQRGRFPPDGKQPNVSPRSCEVAQPPALKWPAEEIEARLQPNDAQRAAWTRSRMPAPRRRRCSRLRASPTMRSLRRAAGRRRQAARYHAAGGEAGACRA